MVGNKTYQTLRNLGVKQICTIQQMSIDLMQRVFGKNGGTIWKKANGIDKTPVVQYSERKSISTERTFERDTTDVKKLRGILIAMAENLAYGLRSGGKLTSCISVKVRYSDFNTHTIQKKIPYSCADHQILPIVMELFEKLYQKRLLIRLVGVRFSHLVSGGYQINLFDDREEHIKLYKAMDYLRNKHGSRSVMRASGMNARSIGRSNPFNGEPPPLLAHRRQ